MDKDIRKHLFDVLESIGIIEQHCPNINDYTFFLNNLLVQDAVQRRLSIIGEAIWKASKISPSLNISNFKKIVSSGIFLYTIMTKWDSSHLAYYKKKLPQLKEEAELILNGHNGSSIN